VKVLTAACSRATKNEYMATQTFSGTVICSPAILIVASFKLKTLALPLDYGLPDQLFFSPASGK
jgi:hypothetical protein